MTEQQYMRSKDVENRASIRQKLQWRLESVLWDVVYWWPCKAMGIERASAFIGWLFRKIGPMVSAHKTAMRNVRMCFPDWDDEKVKATVMEAWDCFGRTAGELPHLPKINPYAEDSRVEVVNGEGLDAIRESGRGAVLISGHFANWEVMGGVICLRPLNCYVTYRALNNPHIDKKLSKLRHDNGVEVLAPKGIGTREVMNALKNNISVGLMNDQKFNQGIPVPMFGHDAMTAPGTTRLAMKYGVPIVPMCTVRTGPARFRVTVYDPIEISDTGNPERDIKETVTRISAFMEDRVRENPGQWFWMHRRWPKEAWKDAGVI